MLKHFLTFVLLICLIGCHGTSSNNNQTIISVSRVSYNQSIGNGALDVYLSIDADRVPWDKFNSIRLEICCQKQLVPVTIHLTKGQPLTKFLALKSKEAFIYELIGSKEKESFLIEKRWFLPQVYLEK